MGLFWDAPVKAKKLAPPTVLAPIPHTEWEPPRDFPNLSAARLLSFDTETYDPYLIEHGPGWARHVGHVVGASVSTEDGYSWYFPMRHEVCPEQNLDPSCVLRWLGDTLGDPRQDKTGANLLYDVGWLAEEGVQVRGRLWDVQFAEALLSEEGKVSLDYLGTKYLGIGKETDALYEWCARSYGGNVDQKQRANIYRSPPSLVGPYATSDATLPVQILKRQWQLLSEQNLLHVFDVESRLIPLLIKMRQQGVTVDIEQAEAMKERLSKRMAEVAYDAKKIVGFDVNFLSGQSLAKAFDALHLKYPRTAEGAPSFVKTFLASVDHPFGALIKEYRECDKLRGTFVQSYILDSHINGRIYCQFHPLRGDDGGTRSGRFSSSTPNLQNIPKRSELGRMLRSMFVPDAGHVQWRKFDYSQIEYRFLAHYALGMGSDGIRQAYIEDPSTDYHEALRQLIKRACGIELSRSNTKTINFGLTYGMGKEKLIYSLGVDAKRGNGLFEAYHTGAPFVRATMEATMEMAQKQGYVMTILGRRSRFDMWEPADWNVKGMALPYEKALRLYGNIKRAYTHKALNRVLQGSSADQLKLALLQCYESGVFDRIGYPRITVHDELDFSDFGGVDDGYAEVKRIMESCLTLKIPVVAEESTGVNWGAAA